MDPVEDDSRPVVRIRPVVTGDLPTLQGIERAAGRAFAAIGMPEVADDEPFSIDVLEAYRSAGWAWSAVDAADVPVAYLVADGPETPGADGAVHVEQVSVHPDHARRGIGRSLLEHAARAAVAAGASALTLTTFEQVPWNAPYSRRCGFRVLPEAEWSPALREARLREAAHGLDRWPRVCMRRDLTGTGAAVSRP